MRRDPVTGRIIREYSEPKTCPTCGVIFHRPHNVSVGLWDQRKTCSRTCMADRATMRGKFWERVAKGDGCWEWQGALMANGYGVINRRGKVSLVHRVAWESENGPIPEGLEVCHMCDNRRCLRPDHLFLGTHRENMADAARKGRMGTALPRYGPANNMTTIPFEIVQQIRTLRANGASGPAIARQFGVSVTHVYDLARRKGRKHG